MLILSMNVPLRLSKVRGAGLSCRKKWNIFTLALENPNHEDIFLPSE